MISHRYYFDCVRVHTADEQLQIPIHAYPVMSRDINQEIFPRVIDFGICAIGTTHTMVRKREYSPLLRFLFRDSL